MMFILSDQPGKKVKSYSGTSRAGKHVLKLEVEYERAYDMAFDIEALEEVRHAQLPQKPSPKRAPRRKAVTAERRLGLPAPEDGQ